MKVFKEKIRNYLETQSYVDDPIGAAMAMVSSIQKLVGIHNVFGDDKRSKLFVLN